MKSHGAVNVKWAEMERSLTTDDTGPEKRAGGDFARTMFAY